MTEKQKKFVEIQNNFLKTAVGDKRVTKNFTK